MLNGQRVTTADQWTNQRRPELKALFEHYMYGHMPPGKTRFTLSSTDKAFFGGKATKKEVVMSFDQQGAPKVSLLVVIPNGQQTCTGFCRAELLRESYAGERSLHTLPESWMGNSCPGCVDNHATDAGRGTQIDTWALEQSIGRGYAVAVFHNGEVEGDLPGAPDGVRAASMASMTGGRSPRGRGDCRGLWITC